MAHTSKWISHHNIVNTQVKRNSQFYGSWGPTTQNSLSRTLLKKGKLSTCGTTLRARQGAPFSPRQTLPVICSKNPHASFHIWPHQQHGRSGDREFAETVCFQDEEEGAVTPHDKQVVTIPSQRPAPHCGDTADLSSMPRMPAELIDAKEMSETSSGGATWPITWPFAPDAITLWMACKSPGRLPMADRHQRVCGGAGMTCAGLTITQSGTAFTTCTINGRSHGNNTLRGRISLSFSVDLLIFLSLF